MAIVHVSTQTANATASGTATITLSPAPTPGNALIVHLMRDGDVSAPTQTAGDTLTSRVNVQGSGERTTQYTNYNVTSAATYTFTFTATSWRLVVSEFSGLNTSQTTADASGTLIFTNAAALQITASGATTNANDLIIGGWNYDGSGSTTFVSAIDNDTVTNWTVPTNGKLFTGGIIEYAVAYRIVSSTGTYGCTVTTADPSSANGVLGAYKAAAGGGPTTLPFMTTLDGRRIGY
jgi:hypothetical protein